MKRFESRSVGAIAHRISASDVLSRLQDHHELILNTISDGILALDIEESILFANPSAAEMLGWSAHELVGKPVHCALHRHLGDGSLYRASSAIYSAMRDRVVRRVSNDVFWRKDGSSLRVDYTCAPIMNEQKRASGSIIIFKNITEKVMGNSRLNLQAQQYRLLFEANPSPMWVLDANSLQILAVNAAALAEYGYSREQFLTLTMYHLQLGKELSQFDSELTEPCGPLHLNGRFRHIKKDGSIISVKIYSAAILWKGTSARIVTAIDASEAGLQRKSSIRAVTIEELQGA